LAALEGGATLNVSGGSVRYADGSIKTTTLTSQGRLYEINSAAKDIVYDGIAGAFTRTSKRFGITETYGAATAGKFELGYVEGSKAGSLALSARTLSSNATLKGDVVAGPLQRDAATRPAAGTLTVGEGARLSQALPDLVGADLRVAGTGAALDGAFWAAPASANATIGGAAPTATVLDATLLRAGGFSNLGLYSRARIVQEAGADCAPAVSPTSGCIRVLASCKRPAPMLCSIRAALSRPARHRYNSPATSRFRAAVSTSPPRAPVVPPPHSAATSPSQAAST